MSTDFCEKQELTYLEKIELDFQATLNELMSVDNDDINFISSRPHCMLMSLLIEQWEDLTKTLGLIVYSIDQINQFSNSLIIIYNKSLYSLFLGLLSRLKVS